MGFLNKVELKKQLQKMGIRVEGGYVKKSDVEAFLSIKGVAVSKYEIKLTVIVPGKLQPFKLEDLQSPGAIDYLGDYIRDASFDPFIDEMNVRELKIDTIEEKRLSKLISDE